MNVGIPHRAATRSAMRTRTSHSCGDSPVNEVSPPETRGTLRQSDTLAGATNKGARTRPRGHFKIDLTTPAAVRAMTTSIPPDVNTTTATTGRIRNHDEKPLLTARNGLVTDEPQQGQGTRYRPREDQYRRDRQDTSRGTSQERFRD